MLTKTRTGYKIVIDCEIAPSSMAKDFKGRRLISVIFV